MGRLRRPQIQTLISMSTWMPRIAKEENLQKLGEEFWPQTPAETMDTGRPAPAAAPYAHARPHGTEKGTAAKRRLQIIAEMLEIMATGVQNAATLTACLTASQPADPAPAQRAHARAPPYGTEGRRLARAKTMDTGPQNPPAVTPRAPALHDPAAAPSAPAHPSRGTAESNDREWKWSQVDWCNDRNGIHGGKIFFIFIFKII